MFGELIYHVWRVNLPCLESYPKHVRDKNSVEVSYNELHSLGEKRMRS
jgi:hypothetical protein